MLKTNMARLFFAFYLLLSLSFTAAAQTAGQSQINWERYAFKKQNFSVALPKLPIVITANDYERSEQTEKFGAFSKGVAYVVAYSFEAKDNPLKKFQAVEPFTENNFAARLISIRSGFASLQETASESQSLENGWQVTELKSEKTIYRLYLNQQDKSWIELQAVRPNDSAADAKQFFDSLKFEKQPQGKEVGDGADHVISDVAPKVPFAAPVAANSVTTPKTVAPPTASNDGISNGIGSGSGIGTNNTKPQVSAETVKPEVEKMRIVLKATPGYTNEARKNNVSGTVRLRATFSASGSVTSVSVISGLPFGLTEKAVAAVRKILFVPEKRNKVTISITRPIEYAFRIY